MPKTTAGTVPPPLRAIGGWPSAEWFCPTVLSDADVIGFTLPKLGGVRKQNFRLVERSAASPAASKGAHTASAAPARRPQAGLAQLLDAYGATRAAAFRRATFLFETAPVLFFAEIPLANLRIRAADSFRQTLVAGAWRACVLRMEPRAVLAMIWPAADQDITAFVIEAAPPHALHAQFDQPLAGSQPPGGPHRADQARTARAEKPLEPSERNRLLRELADLRSRVTELQQSQSALGAMEALGLDDARLKSMLRLLHPDKHGGSEAANDAAKWVNNLRDLLKTARP